jgi:hypothetical protein
MVNNSSAINKTKNHLSPQIIEYKRGYKLINILKLIKYIDRHKCRIPRLYLSITEFTTLKKTGSLDFSLGWLEGEVRENLGNFQKANNILPFLSPLQYDPLSLKKQMCHTMILKRMQSTSLE